MVVSAQFSGKVTETKALQAKKASTPMEVSDCGKITEVKDEHDPKAEPPMVVSAQFFGKVTDVKDEQPWKALFPMEVSDLGKETEVKALHS